MIQRYAFDGAYYEVPYEEGAYVMYDDHVTAMTEAMAEKDRRIAELEARIAEIEMEALVPLDHGCQVVHDLRVNTDDLPDDIRNVLVWYHLDAPRVDWYMQIKRKWASGLQPIAWQELPRWEGRV